MIGQAYNVLPHLITSRFTSVQQPAVRFQTRYGPVLSLPQFGAALRQPTAPAALPPSGLCTSGNCPSARSCYSGCTIGAPFQPFQTGPSIPAPATRIFTGRAVQTMSGIVGRAKGALSVLIGPS